VRGGQVSSNFHRWMKKEQQRYLKYHCPDKRQRRKIYRQIKAMRPKVQAAMSFFMDEMLGAETAEVISLFDPSRKTVAQTHNPK
jgi:hypothetical protein